MVGVIPGPKEPELHMNSYLQPLVEDLKKLWLGVVLRATSNGDIVVCAAHLRVSCDIQAARKVWVFLGHRANKGCSKCLLSFPTRTSIAVS